MIALLLTAVTDTSVRFTTSASWANGLLPPLYDLVWSGSAIVVFAMVVVALVSIARHTDGPSTTSTAVWTAIVVFSVFLGPIAWFVVGRPAARASRLTAPRRAD